MNKIEELLKKAGFSDKAIDYYINKKHVGEIKNPDVKFGFTGPCSDTIEFYLKIKDNIITEVKFQSTGCAGAFAAGSAISEMIKGQPLEKTKEVDEAAILKHLGKVPEQKMHCLCLAKIALDKSVGKYKKNK